MKIKNYLSYLLLFVSSYASSQTFGWAGRFGGSGEDVVTSMHVDSAGNIYTTGFFTDTCDFDIGASETNLTSIGFSDVFVQKTDSNGDLLWAKSFGSNDGDYGTAITVDATGNVYITGDYRNSADFDPGTNQEVLTAAGEWDIFVVKLDASGNFIWAKSIGGTGYEETTAIQISPSGDIILAGYYYDTFDADPGQAEALIENPYSSNGNFIITLSSSGSYISAKRFGGNDFSYLADLKIANNGDTFITGFFQGTIDLNPSDSEEYYVTAQGSQINYNTSFLIKLNNAAEFSSATTTLGGNAEARGLYVDNDGNAYLTGYFNDTVNFGESFPPGNDFIYTSNNAYNAFILKVNPFGAVDWVNPILSNDPVFGFSIVADSDDGLYASGFFSGTADFNGSVTDDYLLTKQSSNAQDAYLCKVNKSSGQFISAFNFGGATFINTHTIGIDSNSNVYLASHFESTVDIDPIDNQLLEVSSVGFRDNYLIKMDSENLSVDESLLPISISIYPNPYKNSISIRSNKSFSNKGYTIYDVQGRVVKQGLITFNNKLSIQDLKQSAYFLTIDNRYTFKIIKE